MVVDWGLAKDLRGAATAAPSTGRRWRIQPVGGDTAAGAVVGTPAFMSPEQAAGKPVDPRADVYALGAILYYVLAGTGRSRSTSPPDRAPAASGRLVPLAALEPRLPPDLLAIVDKAIAADPGRRYPSAFELADDLKRFAGGQLVAARRYSPLVRAGRFVARHPVAVGLALAAAAAGMGIAALALR